MKWTKLIKFIKKNRKKHIAEFTILTTATEIIIVPVDKEKMKTETLRINYK